MLDYLSVGVTIGARVLPNFVLAPVLTLIFTLWLGRLPGDGRQGRALALRPMETVGHSIRMRMTTPPMTSPTSISVRGESLWSLWHSAQASATA